MHYKTIHADYYAGIDVHPNRSQVCVMDKSGQVMLNRNFKNSITNLNNLIQPYQDNIAVGCESTYTYYWLADGCSDSDIPFYLGHAFYMKAISGNKRKNDPLDAKTIANLLRTNYFPEAYPYPRDWCLFGTERIQRRVFNSPSPSNLQFAFSRFWGWAGYLFWDSGGAAKPFQ